MLTTLLLGVLPAALGLLVLLLPAQTRWVGPARTFAVGAALAVVAAELLPAAAEEVGVLALGLALLGIVVPRGLDRALHAHGHGSGLTLGFVALLVHQAFDGLQMGASRLLGGGVTLAIAAHGAPLVAAAVLAYAQAEGPRRALLRGVALLAATAGGIGVGGLVPDAWLVIAAPWVGAVIAGFLVHVVTHGLGGALPRTTPERAAEVISLAAGVALALALLGGGHVQEVHAHHAHDAFGHALVALAAASTPPVLLGLAVAALAGRLVLRARGRQQEEGGLRTRGGRREVVDAVSPEALALTGGLLGGPALALHAVTALFVAVVARRGAVPAAPTAPAPSSLAERARRVSPWVALSVLAGAYVAAFVHVHELPVAAHVAIALGLAAGGVALRAPPAALVPLLAALWAAGLAPAGVLGVLLVVAAVAAVPVGARPSRRVGPAALGATVALAGAAWLPATAPPARVPETWAILMAALVLHALWRDGPRAWLAGTGLGEDACAHHAPHDDEVARCPDPAELTQRG